MADELIAAKETENNLLQRIAKLESRVAQLEKNQMPVSTSAYTVTNGLVDRAYDANTVVVAELADVVYSILIDLETRGIVTV